MKTFVLIDLGRASAVTASGGFGNIPEASNPCSASIWAEAGRAAPYRRRPSPTMQSVSFPEHVFAAAIERDLVLFDSAADRYVALPGAVGDQADGVRIVGHRDLSLMHGAAELLLGASMLVTGTPGIAAKRPLARPGRSLAAGTGGHGRAGIIDVAGFAIAVVQGGRRLKRGLPCGSFTHTRAHQPIVSICVLREAIGRLCEARLLVPHPLRCLPASIVASLFLRRLGQEVEIVFGVRSHPFEAHCWIEADGIVLDDDLDRVRSYTPIAVGRL